MENRFTGFHDNPDVPKLAQIYGLENGESRFF